MHYRSLPTLLVALAFVSAACGGGNGPTAPPGSATNATTSASRVATKPGGSSRIPDPCTLLTSDQVKALYAVAVLDGEHAGTAECTWRPRDFTQAFAGVNLAVQVDDSSFFDMSRNGASKHKDVGGVGDTAFFVDPAAGNVLWFKRGSVTYILTVAAGSRSPDQMQKDVVTLANEILAH